MELAWAKGLVVEIRLLLGHLIGFTDRLLTFCQYAHDIARRKNDGSKWRISDSAV
jgi:hypothetical protein